MPWALKHQPSCAAQLCGNTSTAQELRSWLEKWREQVCVADQDRAAGLDARPEGTPQRLLPRKQPPPVASARARPARKARRGGWGSSDEDFIVDDLVDGSDSSQEDAEPPGLQSCGNALVLSGPCGCGKTAAVYACALELGFQVIEVNAGMDRGGAQLLRLVGEATQSRRLPHQATAGQGQGQGAQLPQGLGHAVQHLQLDTALAAASSTPGQLGLAGAGTEPGEALQPTLPQAKPENQQQQQQKAKVKAVPAWAQKQEGNGPKLLARPGLGSSSGANSRQLAPDTLPPAQQGGCVQPPQQRMPALTLQPVPLQQPPQSEGPANSVSTAAPGTLGQPQLQAAPAAGAAAPPHTLPGGAGRPGRGSTAAGAVAGRGGKVSKRKLSGQDISGVAAPQDGTESGLLPPFPLPSPSPLGPAAAAAAAPAAGQPQPTSPGLATGQTCGQAGRPAGLPAPAVRPPAAPGSSAAPGWGARLGPGRGEGAAGGDACCCCCCRVGRCCWGSQSGWVEGSLHC